MIILDTLHLASGSQDNFIRVYKITKSDNSKDDITNKFFKMNETKYNITLDTVLYGHEAWIYSVKWTQNQNGVLMLLSSSIDKSVILWKQQGENDIITEELRVGNIGGNNLGFIGSLITEDHRMIIGQSYTGALHVWSYNEESSSWLANVSIGGHANSVTDVSWDPQGNYLLSCSSDQTTRLHACWLQEGSTQLSWHQIGRPQIHGYDLNCLAAIDSLTFASGADEKVLRIFKATKSFIKSVQNISNVDLLKSNKLEGDLAEFATLQPLGLSSKAVFDKSQGNEYFKSIELTKPPSEEILAQNTLWPEVHKLYCHGFELFTVTCNHRASLIATACKANKTDHAFIVIWDILKGFKEIARLSFHQLTVTQLKFSPSDEYLVSCSRDRTWALYKITLSDSSHSFERVAFSDKKTGVHSRIIWDVAWTPDSRYFATASRDKKAIFWEIVRQRDDSCLDVVKRVSDGHLVASDSINTIDIASFLVKSCYIIAMGLENGAIPIYSWSLGSKWIHINTIFNWFVLHSLFTFILIIVLFLPLFLAT